MTTARIDARTPDGERVTVHVAADLLDNAWCVWVKGGCLGDGTDQRLFDTFAEALAYAGVVATEVETG